MPMKINFYATLRYIVGQKTVEIQLENGTTVRDLVHRVVAQYPKLGRELIDPGGEIYGHIHLLLNGRDAPYLENGLETVITMQDKIDIFPAVGGG